MNRTGRRCGIAACLIVSLAACSGPEPFAVPDVESWSGEAQVARKIRTVREVVERRPDSADAVGRLGKIFHAHELYPQAIACYERAGRLEPEDGRWTYLAALAKRKIDPGSSVTYFERSIAAGYDTPALRVNLGNTLLNLGRELEAETHYLRALELDAGTTHALYGLAQIDLIRDDLDEAERRLEQASSIAPWHCEVHTLLARLYRRLERPDDARDSLARAGACGENTSTPDPLFAEVEAESVTSRAHTRRGQRFAEEERFAEAEAEFREVLAIRPGNSRDHTNLGGALAGQGRFDEAVEQYGLALELDASDPYAHNNLAMTLAEQGELERANEHLETAIEIEPSYADAHHNLGLLAAGRGEHGAAIEHYREALTHDPAAARVHNDLGTALANRGDLEGASEAWRRALEIDGREMSALYNLCIALTRSGQHREAIDRLRRGLEIAPNSSRLATLLAWELATAPEDGLRNAEEALALAERIHRAYPDRAATADLKAAALAENGRFEEAVLLGEQALGAARVEGRDRLAREIGARLAGYRAGRPYRQAR